MKALLLLIGMGSFSLASAQNNDLFDVNQHLKKLHDKKQVELKKQKLLHPFQGRSFGFNSKKNKPYYLPNGDKVVTLPGYNMPCVVPDMKQFQTMPIAGRNLNMNNYNFMPNPSPKMNIEELIAKGIIKNIK